MACLKPLLQNAQQMTKQVEIQQEILICMKLRLRFINIYPVDAPQEFQMSFILNMIRSQKMEQYF